MIRFTKEEKLILLFLFAVFSIGTTVLYYKKTHPHTNFNLPIFNENVKVGVGVNINKATETELVSLKHIGPVLAERIISYREKHGPFEKIEDIKKVKGIGDKTFESIKDRLILE